MPEMKWNGDAALRVIEADLIRKVAAGSYLVQAHAKELVSIEGTARVSGRGRLLYGANPSRPGQPPHVQTGRLRASIAVEARGLVGRVGTNVEYGRHLEFGTRTMAARPWLRRALMEKQGELRALFATPISGLGR